MFRFGFVQFKKKVQNIQSKHNFISQGNRLHISAEIYDDHETNYERKPCICGFFLFCFRNQPDEVYILAEKCS